MPETFAFRNLLGPGPSNVHPNVLQAMALPPVGHLDPQFIDLMGKIQTGLRYVFQTENELTLAISGTGSAGMEASLVNFIEPGDPVLICTAGYFADRLVEMTSRLGAQVRKLENPWGQVFTLQQIEAALKDQPAKLVAIVHGETSTGACQPMDGIADLVHAHGGLLVMDCVASLAGAPVYVDAWGVDIAYTGSQKCLSVPPGLAPITVSPRAVERLAARKTKVPNWYLDLTLLNRYWGKEHVYHHTAPINLNYALYEGLKLVQEEGLENRWARHRRNAELLWAGLAELGIQPVLPIESRLASLTTVYIPSGVEDLPTRKRLLNEYNLEIAGALGVFAGKVWRIGLMGHSSQQANVAMLIGALKSILG
jgi:alanine-glyoxylate transaminase/serine-glyoxylate transaminase/serine-pyruvate transaminase